MQIVRRAWVAFIALAVMPWAGAQDVQGLITRLADPSADVRVAAWKGAGPLGAPAVVPLLDLMASPSLDTDKAATCALETLVHYASRPGAKAERAAVAAQLTKRLAADTPEATRRQAVRMLALCGGNDEAPAVAELLKDAAFQEEARLALERMTGSAATEALAAAIPAASTEFRIRLMASLAHKNDPWAIPALKAQARSREPEVKWAAMDGLARLGVNPARVSLFQKAKTENEARRLNAARLVSAEALIAHEDYGRAARVYAAAARDSIEPAQVAGALAGLARFEDNRLVPRAVPHFSDPRARDAAVKAVADAKVAGVDEALVSAYGKATPPARAAILDILARRKSSGLAALVASARADGSPEVRIAAAEAAGEAPASQLLVDTIANGSPWARAHAAETAMDQTAAREAADPANAAAVYASVLAADVPVSTRVAAYGGIERVGREESMPVVAKLKPLFHPGDAVPDADKAYLEAVTATPTLAIAAGRAYAAVYASLGRDRATSELLTVLENGKPAEVGTFAVEKLAQLGVDVQVIARSRGFVTTWQILGPFPNANGNGAFQKSLVQESDTVLPDGVAVEGRTCTLQAAVSRGIPAVVNLREYYRESAAVAAYAYAEITSDKDQPVRILEGSDDGCEMWLNGRKVFEAGGARSMVVDGDRIDAALRPGVNRILLKVLQGGGDWQFCVRLAKPDGTPMDLSAQK